MNLLKICITLLFLLPLIDPVFAGNKEVAVLQRDYLNDQFRFVERLTVRGRLRENALRNSAGEGVKKEEVRKPEVYLFFFSGGFDEALSILREKGVTLVGTDRDGGRVNRGPLRAKAPSEKGSKEIPDPKELPDYRSAYGWAGKKWRVSVMSHDFDETRKSWFPQTRVLFYERDE